MTSKQELSAILDPMFFQTPELLGATVKTLQDAPNTMALKKSAAYQLSLLMGAPEQIL